jgi:uncharacterized protein YciI
MKNLFIFMLLTMAVSVGAQPLLPDFLQGTWKMENREVYEHWDKLNENSLKGFSYKMADEQMSITEYLDITQTGNKITYTAFVLNQNQGKGINFLLTQSDSSVVFENPEHDFPKKIVYSKLSDREIFVEVSDGNERGFSFRMIKQPALVNDKDNAISNPNYDSLLAQKLGADDYGMKSFIFVILKTGPNTTTDTQFINQCFRGHLDNINRLAQEGQLVVAGPLGRNDNNYRGIFILDAASIEEARQLLQTDPAVAEGLLEAEIYNWYGSAALPLYLDYSDKIWKQKP